MTSCPNAPPRQCRRCTKLVTDEPRALLSLSDPIGEDTARLCPDCTRLLRGWFFVCKPAPPPLRGRVRVGAVGSVAWDKLFGED